MAFEISQYINNFAFYADHIPGVVIIHRITDLSVVYISKQGEEVLGTSLDELVKIGSEWHNIFFNAEESKEYVPQIIGLLERNNINETLSLFQQVKTCKGWQWYHTSMKIFIRDESGQPLLSIAVASPLDPSHDISIKVSRLLEENKFLRENAQKFQMLTSREKTIIKLIASGLNSRDIAEKLFLSVNTVETHRKNIRKKLEVDSSHRFGEFVRAFNV